MRLLTFVSLGSKTPPSSDPEEWFCSSSWEARGSQDLRGKPILSRPINSNALTITNRGEIILLLQWQQEAVPQVKEKGRGRTLPNLFPISSSSSEKGKERGEVPRCSLFRFADRSQVGSSLSAGFRDKRAGASEPTVSPSKFKIKCSALQPGQESRANSRNSFCRKK